VHRLTTWPGNSAFEAAESLAAELNGLGVRVLYDRIGVLAGVEFTDAELLGVPEQRASASAALIELTRCSTSELLELTRPGRPRLRSRSIGPEIISRPTARGRGVTSAGVRPLG
jgi:hypothetical protein